MQNNNGNTKRKNLTVLTVAILATTIAALSVALILAPTLQQASAQSTSFTFSQNQRNACSGNAGCGNTGTITFSTRPPVCVSIC